MGDIWAIIFLISELTHPLKIPHYLNSADTCLVFESKERCCTLQHSPYARTCAIGGVRWKVGEAPGRRRASCAARLGHGCARLDRFLFLIRCSDCRLNAKGGREALRSSAFLRKDLHRSPPDRLTSPRGVEGGKKNDQRGRAGRKRKETLDWSSAVLAASLYFWGSLRGGDAAGRGFSAHWRRRRCGSPHQPTRTPAAVFPDRALMLVMMLPPPVVFFCSSGSYSSGIHVLPSLDYR